MPFLPQRLIFTTALILALLIMPFTAFANRTLVVTGTSVVVYSGPGKKFRAIGKLSNGKEVPASEKIVEEKGKRYYKVVVEKRGKSGIGYVLATDDVSLKSDAPAKGKTVESTRPSNPAVPAQQSADDLATFSDFRLSQNSIQIAYAQLRSKRALVTLGYSDFVGPGLYLKYQVGAFKSPVSTSPFFGVEGGLDNEVSGRISVIIAGSINMFAKPKVGALFEGSKSNFTNFMVHTQAGIRYSFENLSSVTIAFTQASLFSANNSLPTFGALFALDWPL